MLCEIDLRNRSRANPISRESNTVPGAPLTPNYRTGYEPIIFIDNVEALRHFELVIEYCGI